MKAIRSHEPAGIGGLVYEEVPGATPMIGDVLVKVAACGITHNELDWPLRTCRNGHPRDAVIPGQEVSGVVTALGPGTAGIAVGDEVFGLTEPYRDAAVASPLTGRCRKWPLVMTWAACSCGTSGCPGPVTDCLPCDL